MAKIVALTQAQKAEMEQLKASEHVKLARKELRLQYRQRQILYTLRALEKRDKELEADGITLSNIEEKMDELYSTLEKLGVPISDGDGMAE